ncbi:hypothetical protein F8388_026589 [Cannabis sativa]|uniref:Cyclin-dependent kinase inhibitor domain-containing protein n=1 Tax=Cannabis sativa TaxID=3483 RepID=A0A7J6EC69_CANSA|nr:hypothetical protein F8388_026589 [Cannabis sativa]
MGKYMRKAKAASEVAVMEVSQASLGVRTRAKTLALQRLQKSPPVSKSPRSPSSATTSSTSYIQLRSRRLVKPPPPPPQPIVTTSSKLGFVRNPNRASSSLVPLSSGSPGSGDGGGDDVAEKKKKKQKKEEEEIKEIVGNDYHDDDDDDDDEQVQGIDNGDLGIEEASFGENVLEFEGRERSTRESTPSNLIRDPDIIRTPGSTTKQTNSAETTNRRTQNSSQRHIPTAHEMDEFFAGAEVEQQKQFIDKYNFDPVNEKPLPGRYSWEKVVS